MKITSSSVRSASKQASRAIKALAVVGTLVTIIPQVAEARVVRWGEPGDMPIAKDFDGDGRVDITVWRPSTGEWWTIMSSRDAVLHNYWGALGDVPVAADYDGDGRADVAVWRRSTGQWLIRQSSGGARVETWGGAADADDVPVPADYDGDGKSDIAIWRPATGDWWLKQSRDGIRVVQWGTQGDVPLVGTSNTQSHYNFDGMRGADFVVWRPGIGEVFIRSSYEGGSYGPRTWSGFLPTVDDVPMMSDMCYGEITSRNRLTGAWRLFGFWSSYGVADDIPVPGFYSPFRRHTGQQLAVYRPSEGNWYIQDEHEQTVFCID